MTHEYLAIVTDYAAFGDVADHIDALEHRGLRKPGIGLHFAQARSVFQQLILALHFCHSRQLVNRDLKLENLLLRWDVTRAPVSMCHDELQKLTVAYDLQRLWRQRFSQGLTDQAL